MGFEPQKLFIGLMEFFTILLPGAVLTYLCMGAWGPFILGGSYKDLTTSTVMGGGAFFAVSYVTGHLLFLMGSLLDEYVYDRLRNKHSFNRHLQHVVIRRNVPSWLAREFSFLVFGRDIELPLERAKKIKAVALGRLQAKDDINTFQWSKLQLGKLQPDALALVNRHEADSKFFRSFFVLILLLFASCLVNGIVQLSPHDFKGHEEWLIKCPWIKSLLLVIPAILAFVRYVELRSKAVNQAYWGVIAATSSEKHFPMPPAKENEFFKEYDKVGGLLYRSVENRREFLLLDHMEATEWKYDLVGNSTPINHKKAFVFVDEPREGEHPEVAVTRTILTQTGYWAKISTNKGGEKIKVDIPGAPKIYCFLLEVLKKDCHHIDKSVPQWISESELKNNLSISVRQRAIVGSALESLKPDPWASESI